MNTRLLVSTALTLALSSTAMAQTKWDLPAAYPASNFHTENLVQFANDVDKATGGKLKITVHANASLFKANEIKRAVQGGQAQIGEVLLVNGYSGVDAEEKAALAHVPQSSRMHGVAGPPRKALVLYSLGNFCTTMFNELCRVGLLLTLRVAPNTDADASANPTSTSPPPATWGLPTWHWMYNQAAVVTGSGTLATSLGVVPRVMRLVASDGATATSAAADGDASEQHVACDGLAPRHSELVQFVRKHILRGHDTEGVVAGCERQEPPPMGL